MASERLTREQVNAMLEHSRERGIGYTEQFGYWLLALLDEHAKLRNTFTKWRDQAVAQRTKCYKRGDDVAAAELDAEVRAFNAALAELPQEGTWTAPN